MQVAYARRMYAPDMHGRTDGRTERTEKSKTHIQIFLFLNAHEEKRSMNSLWLSLWITG